MTSHIRIGLLALAVVAFIPLAAMAQDVSIDFDKTVDFTGFTTFSTRQGQTAGNPLVAQRIQAALEAELSARGLTKVDRAGDLVAVYHASIETQVDVDAFGYGRPRWGTRQVYVRNYELGTVIVDLLDAKTDRVVWRGVGRDVVSGDPDKVAGRITRGAERMFKNFPPKKER